MGKIKNTIKKEIESPSPSLEEGLLGGVTRSTTIKEYATNHLIHSLSFMSNVQKEALTEANRELNRKEIYDANDLLQQGIAYIEDLLGNALIGRVLNEKIERLTDHHVRRLIQCLGRDAKRPVKNKTHEPLAVFAANHKGNVRQEKIREALVTPITTDHKLAFVAQIRGVEYINDSKSTNWNTLRYALENMSKPTILIMGGQNQEDAPPEDLLGLMKEKVRAIVALGSDNTFVYKRFQPHIQTIIDTHDIHKAVEAAADISERGDVVLLSPAAASFDLFKNYEDRGTQFANTVKNL